MTQTTARQRLSALLDDEVDHGQADLALVELGDDADLRASWGRYHLIRGVLRGERVASNYHRIAERVSEHLDNELFCFANAMPASATVVQDLAKSPEPSASHPRDRSLVGSPTETGSEAGAAPNSSASGDRRRMHWPLKWTLQKWPMDWLARGRAALPRAVSPRFPTAHSPTANTPAAVSPGWWPVAGAALSALLVLVIVLELPEGLLRTDTPGLVRDIASADTDAQPSARSEAGQLLLTARPTRAGAPPSRATSLGNAPAAHPGAPTIQPWSASQPHLKAKLNYYLVGHQERVSSAAVTTAGNKGFLPYATLVGYSSQP